MDVEIQPRLMKGENQRTEQNIAAICNIFKEVVYTESYSNDTSKLPKVTWGAKWENYFFHWYTSCF